MVQKNFAKAIEVWDFPNFGALILNPAIIFIVSFAVFRPKITFSKIFLKFEIFKNFFFQFGKGTVGMVS